jgi:hypothetical protein
MDSKRFSHFLHALRTGNFEVAEPKSHTGLALFLAGLGAGILVGLFLLVDPDRRGSVVEVASSEELPHSRFHDRTNPAELAPAAREASASIFRRA